jgi:hypothetical protein
MLRHAFFAAVFPPLILMAAPSPGSNLPLRVVNPDLLSGGLFSALDAQGAFGRAPLPLRRERAGVVDLSKGKPPLVLDARVGTNIRLGDDPAALPLTQRGQAEPHLARSGSNPALLLATFQDGRFVADGGALDCGYSISRDGGLTWTRDLIPQLTQASGGIYFRATDPVAAIGPQGDLYLNTLASLDNAFGIAALVVSRSTDNGATWSAPAVVFRASSTLVMPDKNWLAVNDYPGTPTTGRLVATWTNFTFAANGASTGSNLLAAISDDRGVTWSTPVAVTAAGSVNQGSQPVFLPDGSLLIVYSSFNDGSTATQFSLQCKRSLDGGRTFPVAATTLVGSITGWDDPDIRDGVYLPTVGVARTTSDIFVAYTGVTGGSPRVFVVKSSDQGTTWTSPAIVSDQPAGVSVMNPAIAVAPDGAAVSVVFMDRRNGTSGNPVVDHYAALSVDGGATWQPNLRLTEMSSDIRYATATSRGYMLGDYLGLAPPLASEPCVAIWCDTRTGDADPFTVRFTPASTPSYTAWATAHGITGFPADDPDHDGFLNGVEFRLGTDPLKTDAGETFVLHRVDARTVDAAWVERTDITDSFPVSTFANFGTTQVVSTSLPSTPLTADQLPTIPLRPNVRWVGARFTSPADTPFTVGHGLKFSAGIPYYVSGELATANTDSRLINVSTRGQVKTGDSQLIVGFVVDGQKTMLVRAAGPALAAFGVTNAIADPQLQLTGSGPVASAPLTNDNWSSSTASTALFSRLGAFPFAANSGDASLVQTVAHGSYSAIISGVNNGTGIALAEAYDADSTPGAPTNPRLLNLSSRGEVGSGDQALIAGFVITGTQPHRMLIRAVGPTLTSFGITAPLNDPVLALYRGTTVVATNDDWEISRSSPAVAATAQRLGAFPLNAASLDAALLITLDPGAYTTIVTGANGTAGVALVEVYDAD